jgi:hypothetical protein
MSRQRPRFDKPSKKGSKNPPVPLNAEDRRLANLNPAKPENRIAAYKAAIDKLEKQIKRLEPNFVGVNDLVSRIGIFTEFGFLEYLPAKAKLENLRRQKEVQELRLRTYKSSLNPSRKSQKRNEGKKGSNTPPATSEEPGAPPPTPGPPPVIYNAGAVKDAYFKMDQSLFKKQTDPKGYARGVTEIDGYIYSGNTPTATVINAIDLWKNSTSGKGMIQTYMPEGGFPPSYSTGETSGGFGDPKTMKRYGFQFLYNPGNITMTYGGVPDIDIGLLTSGKEEYNFMNPSIFKSGITFDVLINRMFDMQYLGPGGKLKGETQLSQIYSGKIPTDRDLKRIYNRGTMYDLEFLLQTMFGTAPLTTQLRDKTWDIGFLGPSPVEMHLGNKLRYKVLIESINVNHVIFDHRMVPLFTSVSISARRIPDYKVGEISDASQSSNITPRAPAGIPRSADAAERWIEGSRR